MARRYTAAQRKSDKSEQRKDNIAVVVGVGGMGLYATQDRHLDWAHNAKRASAYAKNTRPTVGRSGVGVSKVVRGGGSTHFTKNTHSVAFHKSAHRVYQASTAPSFSNHGFSSRTHTTHSISAPVAIGGAAALAGAAGGAYYWRKRKNGQRSRVKKGVRK